MHSAAYVQVADQQHGLALLERCHVGVQLPIPLARAVLQPLQLLPRVGHVGVDHKTAHNHSRRRRQRRGTYLHRHTSSSVLSPLAWRTPDHSTTAEVSAHARVCTKVQLMRAQLVELKGEQPTLGARDEVVRVVVAHTRFNLSNHDRR
jgi:hypothetical protein